MIPISLIANIASQGILANAISGPVDEGYNIGNKMSDLLYSGREGLKSIQTGTGGRIREKITSTEYKRPGLANTVKGLTTAIPFGSLVFNAADGIAQAFSGKQNPLKEAVFGTKDKITEKTHRNYKSYSNSMRRNLGGR